ncbi:MAG: putative septation protein SpoVG [Elusimicrobia bacterium ADurb.Bin231]|nr:MAG: putative septation protein SpoVG [Elusimicrobia bacterium ADurb.Bin231]
MLKKFSVLLLAAMLFARTNIFAAGEIFVTSVKQVPAAADSSGQGTVSVVLNDCVEIREIEVVKAEGVKSLKYPVYVSARGKEYPQVEVLTKQAKDEIEKAVFSNKASPTAPKTITFKISKFSIYNRPSSLKAFVSVDFNNSVRVEAKVMGGKRGPWVSWPSRKDESTGKYKKQILLVNKKVQTVVEKAILARYAKASSESSDAESEE